VSQDPGRAGTGNLKTNPLHMIPRDKNQYSINGGPPNGGRLPSGRLLSGVKPDSMVYHPRMGSSRTQFGGIWEDHKTEDVIPKSITKSGYSDFNYDDPHESTTYANHFGAYGGSGEDTMGDVKPNVIGTATMTRGVNGFGRNRTGGFYMREQLGELKRYKHVDAWRSMPSWARCIPEPTRPGPGFTRNDQGGYFRT